MNNSDTISINIGDKIDYLTITKKINPPANTPVWKSKMKHYLCECVCGKSVVKTSRYLRDTRNTNAKRSCGCSATDYIVKRNIATAKHNLSKDRIYIVWSQIKQRCYNPNHNFYHRYGGRGIRMHHSWLEPAPNGFLNFVRDMGKRPSDDVYETGRSKYTIDRIDTDGDYTPQNCRWATYKEQWNTRRNYK